MENEEKWEDSMIDQKELLDIGDSVIVNVEFTKAELDKIKKEADYMESSVPEYLRQIASGDRKFLILKRIAIMTRLIKNLNRAIKTTEFDDDDTEKVINKLLDINDEIDDIIERLNAKLVNTNDESVSHVSNNENNLEEETSNV